MKNPSGRLALCGPMGAGKSSVGGLAARWLGAEFEDLDRIIVAREGRTIPELFDRGESVFRRAEREALAWWLDHPGEGAQVLALGGGTLEDPASAAALSERTTLVHLDATEEQLFERLSAEEVGSRPLLANEDQPLERLADLRRERAGGYARSCLRVETGSTDVAGAALLLLRSIYGPQGPWNTPPTILSGQIGQAGVVTAGRGSLPLPPAARAVLLWDRNLPAGHGKVLLPCLETLAAGNLLLIAREGGEGAKTPESLLALWRELLDAGIDKDVPLWVAGGGTLTDLGGFLAHTFKRGMPCGLLPTTLLAQLDAGLGGKTGINLDTAKNAVGTIRIPQQVHLDSLFLLTLQAEDLQCGLSEAIKSGLIADAQLVDLIEAKATGINARELPLLEEITVRAAQVKLKIVEQDLYEGGQRRLLNFGHTLGHAIESVRAKGGHLISHGEAVAAGMVFATRLAERLGVLEDHGLIPRLEALLDALGLPSSLPPLGAAGAPELLAELRHDKKRRAGENVWVLPVSSGRLVATTVSEVDVAAALGEW